MSTSPAFSLHRIAVAAFLLQSTAVLVAQDDPAWISPFPAVMVKEDTASKPMRMSGLQVSVEVIGNIARTTLDMRFYNDLDRVLEGELYFPLGEGQSVSRFAMEVNGSLRDAVPVEQEKARVAYEGTVRRGVDPGLLEWTKGNNFKSRIYPIPAKGYKRVVVAYEQELRHTPEGEVYLLPLSFPDAIDRFGVRVEVIQSRAKPTLAPNGLANIAFAQVRNSYVAELNEAQYTADKSLGFLLPASTNGTQLAIASASEGSGAYFYTHVVLPTSLTQGATAPVLPKNILLLWDASASAAKRDTAKEFAVLDGYLRAIGNVGVSLVAFRNAPDAARTFAIKGGNWGALRKAIIALPLDGGTSLGCLAPILADKNLHPEAILLSSDGISTFGEAKFPAVSAPVHTLTSVAASDFSALKWISQASGGIFINANALTPAQAIALMTKPLLRFMRAEVDGAGTLRGYPSIPTAISDGGFGFAGYTSSNAAMNITLYFGVGNTVLHTHKVTIGSAQADSLLAGGLIERIFAQKQLAELDLDYARNKAAIAALGKRYCLVTRSTSLLILDAVQEYVRYEIIPPAELRAEYDRLTAQGNGIRENNEKAHLQRVIQDFEARKAWWKRDFAEVVPAKKVDAKPADVGALREQMDSPTAVREEMQVQTLSAQAPQPSVTSRPMGVSAEERQDAPSSNAASGEFAGFDGGGGGIDFGSDGGDESFGSGEGTSPVQEEAGTGNADVGNGDSPDAQNREHAATQLPESNKNRPGIALASWDPKAPYLDTLRAVVAAKQTRDSLYRAYLGLRGKHGNAPSFFLDVADYFRTQGDSARALRILSNIAELKLEDHTLLRVLAHRLEQMHDYPLATATFREVLALRGEEPQSYRDLALAFAAANQRDSAAIYLAQVVARNWDSRFPGIEALAACELNALGTKRAARLLPAELANAMPCDLRVVLDWDTDNCDMDLWVTDPSGEKCYYQHRETTTGGWMSFDFTGGYGPEEFWIKTARKGTYKVQINYYGTNQQTLIGATTVQARLITGYGTPAEKQQAITLRLETNKQIIDVGEVVIQ